MAVKSGIKSQLHKFNKMRAETIDVVRERVFKIIKGKKLVGYHLPQKMADFGLFDHDTVDGVLQDVTNKLVPSVEVESDFFPKSVPNSISPRKEKHAVVSSKQQAFQKLEL